MGGWWGDDTTEAYKTSRYIPLLQLLRQILGALGWEIVQTNFTVGVWDPTPTGVHTGIPVRWLPGRTRGPPLKVQLDPRQMLQDGTGHARVHAPVLLPNSGPKRREAPGGQSNADFHPTRGDYTPLPL